METSGSKSVGRVAISLRDERITTRTSSISQQSRFSLDSESSRSMGEDDDENAEMDWKRRELRSWIVEERHCSSDSQRRSSGSLPCTLVSTSSHRQRNATIFATPFLHDIDSRSRRHAEFPRHTSNNNERFEASITWRDRMEGKRGRKENG